MLIAAGGGAASVGGGAPSPSLRLLPPSRLPPPLLSHTPSPRRSESSRTFACSTQPRIEPQAQNRPRGARVTCPSRLTSAAKLAAAMLLARTAPAGAVCNHRATRSATRINVRKDSYMVEGAFARVLIETCVLWRANNCPHLSLRARRPLRLSKLARLAPRSRWRYVDRLGDRLLHSAPGRAPRRRRERRAPQQQKKTERESSPPLTLLPPLSSPSPRPSLPLHHQQSKCRRTSRRTSPSAAS